MIRSYTYLLLFIYVVLSTFSSFAYAVTTNTPTDAGDALRQIERIQEIERPKIPKLIEKKEEKPLLKEGEKVKVTSFVFKGNKIIATEDLESFVKKYIGTELTFDEINQAVVSISLLYERKGYLAQATLPEQNITDGIIQVNILEAHFGGTSYLPMGNGEKPNVRESRVMDIVYPSSKVNGPLDLKRLERGILLANDLPGIGVGANLKPGQEVGHTDVEVQIENRARFNTSILADNYGSRSTGYERVLVSANLLNPLRLGDDLNATILKTAGTEYMRLNYSLPMGNDGLRIGSNATYLEYKVITNEFKSLEPNGHLAGFGLEASYPIYRSRDKNLNLDFDYDVKAFKNNTISEVTSDYFTRIFSTSLSGDFVDQWLLDGATNNAKFVFDHGKNDLKNSPNYATDISNSHTHGIFNRAQLSFRRDQFLKNDYTLVIKGSGQFTDHNLDSSQKFYLGGPTGVRAYPSSEGSGSEGYLLNLELKKDLPFNLTGSIFYDEGYVRQNVDNFDASGVVINALNTYKLKGYGLEFSWRGPLKTNVFFTYAKRNGTNPNRVQDTGKDQDGTLYKDIFWLRAVASF
ncbi:ShlB/FhaC/HecB family hemolysin secretion/activation protein [Candidatus Methylopumilus universalis]|uniref:ShlB/FhaC/HecB family hemolysin secretion/activation protein n=1 Tax=Candidatus Methylopumilus universalis TaxID=2588536 RepID=UPI001121B92C|nr:ShlB/FhaC/HecB family hemolysin secretion/activation protein [Candidatus Methylopumilus universalis]QDC50503.1 ShlB/FhaC/HecB family hemolysin secretion/activation protein [Candidatus Methylopumilus universalis]